MASSGFAHFICHILTSGTKGLDLEMLKINKKLIFGFWLKSPSFKDLLKSLGSLAKGNSLAFEILIL